MKIAHERIMTGWLTAAIWAITRAIMAMIWDAKYRFIEYDVGYYFRELENKSSLAASLVEYPAPVVWLLKLIHIVSGSDAVIYEWTFVACMFILDAIVTGVLWHHQGRAAALYWTIYLFLVGALIWFRIDLIPGAAVCLGMVWLLRRPTASGAAIAFGAATKLWPALLILPLVGTHKQGLRRMIGFTITGSLLGGASLAFMGWQRSVSPLTWQNDRGLQIESIVASWPMFQQSFNSAPLYRIFLSKYNAWEISGPGTDTWIAVGDALMIVVVALSIVLTWLIAAGGVGLPGHSLAAAHKSSPSLRYRAMLTATVAVVCAVIVANKTFSPQYVIWLSGPLALLIAQRGQTKRDCFHAIALASLGLIVAFLTHQIFPLNYSDLLRNPHNGKTTTVILLVRNGLVVVMTFWAIVRSLTLAWRVGRIEPAQ